ncbi:Transport permease protein [Pseudodesulfovibrio profundus]|uniref:Transport permease protein n=1 Tax=Pseudodesulfovibrio profundus TaxID=57320 RepID=A0A2C8FDD0_9BACT|nr:ABC transporter permease [Pseudodesulfovibrio profundus]SOB60065.1 Transport permease protein [Pseudodesulfovibrio profundus]
MFNDIRIANNFWEALQLQIRVIYALMLRETKTMYGRSSFGYLWVIVQTAFGIVVFWGIREVMGAKTEGIPIPVFLITGFTAWNLFSDSLNKLMAAVNANTALLYYSKVRHFDLFLSRVLLCGATNLVVLVLMLTAADFANIDIRVSNLYPFIVAWMLLMAIGSGLGMMCCGLQRYLPSVGILVSMILRIALFISGVIFPYSAIPADYQFLAEMNPIFHLIEYSRESFSYSYTVSFVDLRMVSMVALMCLLAGFLVETGTRKKVDLV